ncbi:MBL fold metallo-hydrolase [Edaphobacillus lindanitolerans]|uniref:Glyoxylase, beta-lactamase superfamily II n=1 Tax=Edaphobacillus lindanitolerans TaxID=550447 RepID=A0A1U7PRE8_9BACI|nr:MBL fold metallo-hydrolase [Edaphobacillus lindanitolerans]SIT92642.1 Glyoxylase, beta-lactamase superfamily II [Edaphobacillus lindanitolerans]
MISAMEDKIKPVHPVVVPSEFASLSTFNFFLVEREGRLILIDAGIGSERSMESLSGELGRIGAGITDLDAILLTHHHEDHIGLVPRILEEKRVPVYAHGDAAPRLLMDTDFLGMRLEFFRRLYREAGCGEMGSVRFEKLEQTIREAGQRSLRTEIIEIGEGDSIYGFEVIGTPGHSPDCITFFDPEARIAFTGDVLLGGSSVNAIIDPDPGGNRLPSVLQQRESLKKIGALDADVLYPGHGEPITGQRRLVADRLGKMDRKDARILDLIAGGKTVPAEIAAAYYGDKYRTLFSLVMSEIIGHLDWLESGGRVEKQMSGGIWHYRLA